MQGVRMCTGFWLMMVSCEHGNKCWNFIKDRISKVAELFLICISCNAWSLFLIVTSNDKCNDSVPTSFVVIFANQQHYDTLHLQIGWEQYLLCLLPQKVAKTVLSEYRKPYLSIPFLGFGVQNGKISHVTLLVISIMKLFGRFLGSFTKM